MTNKILLGVFLSVFNATAGSVTDIPTAWLETSFEQGRLIVSAYVKAAKASTLKYDLLSMKSGKSGNSKTRQSGSVETEVDKILPLTRLRLGYNPDDEYNITLSIYENSDLIIQKSISFP